MESYTHNFLLLFSLKVAQTISEHSEVQAFVLSIQRIQGTHG
jgi:hypothetical protein